MSIKEAVVLLSCQESKVIGSAFIIAHDHDNSYLLTCVHVLEKMGIKNNAGNKFKLSGLDGFVEIICCGASDGIDIALLRVAKLDKPALQHFALGSKQEAIQIAGYSHFDSAKNQHVKRPLQGELGESIEISSASNSGSSWDIHILGDEFAELAKGYSGSPLCNQAGQVIGIVTHLRTKKRGHALCISNLLSLYPKIVKLIPTLQTLTHRPKITQIKAKLAQRQDEISEIYQALIALLDQFETIEPNKEINNIISLINIFLSGGMEGNNLTFALSSQLQPQTITPSVPNYQSLAKRLQKGEIVLCTGADLPIIFDPSFSSSAALPSKIAKWAKFEYQQNTPLAEVCEQAELHRDCPRSSILAELEHLLNCPKTDQANRLLYELLSQLKQPFLAIAGGLDTLLEQHLSACNYRFVAVICNLNATMEKQRFIVNYSDKPAENCSNEQFTSLQLMEKGYSIIYYPRGYPDSQHDMVLLSERDYFDNAVLPNRRYPDYLSNKLARSGLCFLGYCPDSWETRLLAKILLKQRGKIRDKALVIQQQASSFEQLFWDDNRCHYYPQINLQAFVNQLKAAVDTL